MIQGFRDRGLISPFTSTVYGKAGISDSLIPRVKNSMEALDLVDADGNPTPLLLGLRGAKTDEFQARLADVVRSAYAEVFQFADPMKDDLNRVTDAFRDYIPHGQRARMVTLFMGLCEAAGLAPASTAKPAPSNGRLSAMPKKKAPAPARRATPPVTTTIGTANGDSGAIPPALLGVLHGLPSPEQGWTREQRDHFYSAFGSLLDFAIPIRAAAAVTNAPEDDEGDA